MHTHTGDPSAVRAHPFFADVDHSEALRKASSERFDDQTNEFTEDEEPVFESHKDIDNLFEERETYIQDLM